MKFIQLAFLLFTSCLAHSHSDLVIGKNFSINSNHLKGEREFYVNLPKGYADSNKRYPVLYVLDGQMHFSSAVAIQHSIGNSTDIPGMIIVGIKNTYPQRRDLKRNQKQAYTSFLSDELIPLIDKKYRVSSERIIFGWEMGSFFSSYLLFHESQLFNAAIVSNGAFSNEQVLDKFDSINVKSDRYLYIANSIRDIFTIDSTNKLVNLLKEKSLENLNWKYDEFDKETHSSLPYLAMYHGLRYYYHNYNAYDFYSIKQYEAFGGIPAIKSYFEKRAKRFGFSKEIDDSTKNTLIWLSWKRDNFKYFDYFMTEFKDVLAAKRYQSNYWQNRLGQFYLKNKSYEKAKYHFDFGIDKFKGSAKIYNGLGKVYSAQNNKEFAIQNFKTAIALAEKNSDENLQHYINDLEEMH